MLWNYISSKRTYGFFTDFFNGVNAARRTSGNLALAVEFDVRRQVVWKTDAVAIGQVIFQCELIRGSINLAKVVDAGVAFSSGAISSIADTIWYRDSYD